jgi:hypothetical protein
MWAPRKRFGRIMVIAASAASAAGAPVAAADVPILSERVGEHATVTRDPVDLLRAGLAQYAITGVRADSYLAQRADNPHHAPITARSLFHAGDPGATP